MNPLDQAGELIDKVGNNVDKVHESGEERQSALTERLRIDMSSDNKLSKSIRPISLIWLLSLYTLLAGLIAGLMYADITVEPLLWFSGEVTVLLGTVLGFYFNSKKAERIQEKRALATIKIEEEKIKSDARLEKEKTKLTRKAIKRAIRRGEMTPEEVDALFDHGDTL